MTTPSLTVSHRVVTEMVRVAALEVPGVLKVSRGGAGWRAWLSGTPVRADVRAGTVRVRVWLVARPGHALRPLAAQVRQAVAATVERLLGLELDRVDVVVDGVGPWGG
ncbi:MAG TPA: Asp23/Gls24 family envelope stress response protein [Candidatus Limnocylindrales bacterium]